MSNLVEAARFEAAGDLRVMSVGGEAAGEQVCALVLQEDISGPSVLVGHGAEAARLKMSVAPSGRVKLIRAVAELFGARSLTELAAREDIDILDVMDLCDREQIPYEFSCIDSNEDAALRPAR